MQVTAHTDLQMCRRKFRPIKYTRRYSYAKFGTFLGQPGIYMYIYVYISFGIFVD